MTTAPSHQPASHASDPHASLAQRQRTAIGALVAMIREHDERRQEIDRALETALAEAESACAAAVRSAEDTHAASREQTEHERDKALRNTKKKYDEQSAEALRAHNAARSDAVERLDSELRTAEEKLRDAAWLAEASFEGGSEQPKLELERVRNIVRDEFGKLDTIENHARRLAGPRIAFPPSTPDEQTQADADETAGSVLA